MDSKKFLFPLGLVMGVVLSLGFFFSWQFILADWTNPPENPPSGNVASPVNVSSNAQYKPGFGNNEGLGLDRLYSTTTASHFYIDSEQGAQIRLDSASTTDNEVFQINNGGNNTVFSVDEGGVVKVNNTKLINCPDGYILFDSSTSPNGLDCSNGLTYGE